MARITPGVNQGVGKAGSRAGRLLLAVSLFTWLGVFPLSLFPPLTLAQTPATGVSGAEDEVVRRGEYLLQATGGCGCHTVPASEDQPAGQFLAGGRPVHTPFGIYFSTNITPDPDTGLGRWSEADFILAMTEGLAPNGDHYFPAFPYTSFTRIQREDLQAMWAYLQTVPPVHQANRPHDVWPPFSWRWPLGVWKWMNFRPGVFQPHPEKSSAWNRGAYLVQALAHCGECHSPRDLSGGLKREQFLSGGEHLSPKPVVAANLTPHPETGISGYSVPDMVWLLQTGFRPDGNDVQGVMLELIEKGYVNLTKADLQAIAEYLLALEPLPGLAPKSRE